MKMKNNAVLITGSAKRIGRELAILLAEKGFDIAIHCFNSKDEANKLAAEIIKKFKVKCEVFSCDLQNTQASKKLILDVIKKFPHLNLLINNASIFRESKFLTAPDSELQNNLNIHFISPLILAKEFAKHAIAKKIKDAQIINMVDKNIARFDTSYFYYLLSKKNLADLTKMLALELAPYIRVNGVAPGFILDSINPKDTKKEFVEKLLKKIPLKRKGEVKNICQTIEFLLANDFVNGEIIFVDGAASLNHAG